MAEILAHSRLIIEDLAVYVGALLSIIASLCLCLFPCCHCGCRAKAIQHRQTWSDWSIIRKEDQSRVLCALAASQATYKQELNSRQELRTRLPGVRLKLSSKYQEWNLTETDEWKLYDTVTETTSRNGEAEPAFGSAHIPNSSLGSAYEAQYTSLFAAERGVLSNDPEEISSRQGRPPADDPISSALVIAFRGTTFDDMDTKGIYKAFQEFGRVNSSRRNEPITLLSLLYKALQLINLVGAVRQAIPRDVEADLQAIPANGFHGGFEKRARQFLQWLGDNDYDEGVRRLRNHALEEDNHPVWLVGHSLGGAVATVVTLSLMEDSENTKGHAFPRVEELRRQVQCITFGAPMVHCGDDAPILTERETNAAAIVCNFVHVDDPVPRILLSPVFSLCNVPCMRRLRSFLHYRPLGTYYLLDEQLQDIDAKNVVTANAVGTAQIVKNKLDRPHGCSLAIHAVERHSLGITYGKYIELLNMNRSSHRPESADHDPFVRSTMLTAIPAQRPLANA